MVECRNRTNEAEIVAKRKTKMVNDLTVDNIDLQKKLKAKDGDIERLKFDLKYYNDVHKEELDKLNKHFKKIEADIYNKTELIKRLEKDLDYWKEMVQDTSGRGIYIFIKIILKLI